MTAKVRLLPLILFLASPIFGWAAGGCILPQGGIGETGSTMVHSGIGGTGSPTTENGIGGTGMPVARSGIGGTGQPLADGGGIGGTGIVGAITGFGSVCVNGLEVEFDNQTSVNMNGRSATLHDLAVGQVISLQAEYIDGVPQTSHIDVINLVEGPVTVNAQAGQIEVMGQKVILPPGDQSSIQQMNYAPETYVRVSGYRGSQGEIHATLIQASKPTSEVSIIGNLDQSSTNTVNNVRINRGLASAIPKDRNVMLQGEWDGKQLNVTHITSEPYTRNWNEAHKVILEGIPLKLEHGNKIEINGFIIDNHREISGISANEDRMLTIEGSLNPDRTVHVENIRLDFHRGAVEIRNENIESDASHEQDRGKLDRHEGMENIERPEQIERPEAVDRPERIDLPERID